MEWSGNQLTGDLTPTTPILPRAGRVRLAGGVWGQAGRGANHPGTRGVAYNRDRNDAEVDLVIEHLDSVTLLEAKSAQTASSPR